MSSINKNNQSKNIPINAVVSLDNYKQDIIAEPVNSPIQAEPLVAVAFNDIENQTNRRSVTIINNNDDDEIDIRSERTNALLNSVMGIVTYVFIFGKHKDTINEEEWWYFIAFGINFVLFAFSFFHICFDFRTIKSISNLVIWVHLCYGFYIFHKYNHHLYNHARDLYYILNIHIWTNVSFLGLMLFGVCCACALH